MSTSANWDGRQTAAEALTHTRNSASQTLVSTLQRSPQSSHPFKHTTTPVPTTFSHTTATCSTQARLSDAHILSPNIAQQTNLPTSLPQCTASSNQHMQDAPSSSSESLSRSGNQSDLFSEPSTPTASTSVEEIEDGKDETRVAENISVGRSSTTRQGSIPMNDENQEPQRMKEPPRVTTLASKSNPTVDTLFTPLPSPPPPPPVREISSSPLTAFSGPSFKSPSPPALPKPKKRQMSLNVPRLSAAEKATYRPLRECFPSRIQKNAHGQRHATLGDALQFAIDNNERSGTLVGRSKPTVPSKRKRVPSTRYDDFEEFPVAPASSPKKRKADPKPKPARKKTPAVALPTLQKVLKIKQTRTFIPISMDLQAITPEAVRCNIRHLAKDAGFPDTTFLERSGSTMWLCLAPMREEVPEDDEYSLFWSGGRDVDSLEERSPSKPNLLSLLPPQIKAARGSPSKPRSSASSQKRASPVKDPARAVPVIDLTEKSPEPASRSMSASLPARAHERRRSMSVEDSLFGSNPPASPRLRLSKSPSPDRSVSPAIMLPQMAASPYTMSLKALGKQREIDSEFHSMPTPMMGETSGYDATFNSFLFQPTDFDEVPMLAPSDVSGAGDHDPFNFAPAQPKHWGLRKSHDSESPPVMDGTVDPSLLGGVSLQDIAPTNPPSPLTSPSPQVSPQASPQMAVVGPSTLDWRQPSFSRSISPLPLPKRERKRRAPPEGMFSHGDYDEDQHRASRPPKIGPPVNAGGGKGKGKGKGRGTKRLPWPQTDAEEYFCHHCRGRSSRQRMICVSNKCAKAFCIKCIYTWYNGVYEFKDGATFDCPICNGECRCDVCTRKRGEEYVPQRYEGEIPVFDQVDHDDGSTFDCIKSDDLSELQATEIVQPLTFLGPIYHIQSGINIGGAFAGSSGKLDVVLAKLKYGVPAKPRRDKHRFSGKIQPGWLNGKKAKVRERNPVREPPKDGVRRARYFIGKRPPPRPLVVIPTDEDADGDYDMEDDMPIVADVDHPNGGGDPAGMASSSEPPVVSDTVMDTFEMGNPLSYLSGYASSGDGVED